MVPSEEHIFDLEYVSFNAILYAASQVKDTKVQNMSQQQEKVQFTICITETALACTKVACYIQTILIRIAQGLSKLKEKKNMFNNAMFSDV